MNLTFRDNPCFLLFFCFQDWIDNPPIFKSLHRKIFLARKLDRVCAAQDGSSSGVSIPLREVEPCWLISYINYSAHIGLPYILSNGRTGVFFEDKTTLLFEPTGKVENGFEYLVGSKQCEMDEASAECKRKVSQCSLPNLKLVNASLSIFSCRKTF